MDNYGFVIAFEKMFVNTAIHHARYTNVGIEGVKTSNFYYLSYGDKSGVAHYLTMRRTRVGWLIQMKKDSRNGKKTLFSTYVMPNHKSLHAAYVQWRPIFDGTVKREI